MITFLDGPAADVTLHLRRAPILLRVVRSPSGKWDALDQLEDVAKPREEIFLYILTGNPIECFIRPGGYCPIGSYKHLSEEHVDDATLRDNAAWSSWCEANRDRLMPEWAQVKSAEATMADGGAA